METVQDIVLFIWPYLVEHSSSSATALITGTVQVLLKASLFAYVTVTARALVTVLCYLCVLKCLFIYYYYYYLYYYYYVYYVKPSWANIGKTSNEWTKR